MTVLILSSVTIFFSILLIGIDYSFIKNQSHSLEERIKRYIFGGIELLIIGAIIIILCLFGIKDVAIAVDTMPLLLIILFSISIYIMLVLLWNKLFSFFDQDLRKIERSKSVGGTSFHKKYKSITIYGLVYAFGVMFYLLYVISYLK